jgi:hypothetical protein
MSSQSHNKKREKCVRQYTSNVNAEYEWCKTWQTKHLGTFTSENEKIDNLFQEMRSKSMTQMIYYLNGFQMINLLISKK